MRCRSEPDRAGLVCPGSIMAAEAIPSSVLREFCPLYYLLNAIPAKVPTKNPALNRAGVLTGVCVCQVQRGFRSVLVYLTALDCSGDFLAVGSSIGMLYLYCRRQEHMNKYNLEVRVRFWNT